MKMVRFRMFLPSTWRQERKIKTINKMPGLNFREGVEEVSERSMRRCLSACYRWCVSCSVAFHLHFSCSLSWEGIFECFVMI